MCAVYKSLVILQLWDAFILSILEGPGSLGPLGAYVSRVTQRLCVLGTPMLLVDTEHACL